MTTMITDNILIALWLYATGGFDSPFFPLFYAEAAASVGRFGSMIGSLSAIGSAVLYVAVLAVDGGGPPYDVIARTGYIFVIVAFVAYVVEVSRRAEREVATAEAAAEAYSELARLKAGFVSTISHELRTPLTTIKGATSTLLRASRKIDAKEGKTLLEMVDRQAERLGKLIQDLIDMATLDRGRLDFHPVVVDITDIVRSEVDRITADAARRVTLITSGSSPQVLCDPPLISRAVHNLLDNAVKFSPDGSVVDVSILDRGSDVHIEVTDRGIGIAPEDQERIFDRFFQVDTSLTRDVYGTGVGLNIALEVMRLHRGELKVHSEPGRGARFTIVLAKEPELVEPDLTERRSA